MKVQPKPAWHALDAESAIFEPNPAKLPKAEGGEPILVSEAWKPRFSSLPDPPEKGLISLIKALQSPALQSDWEGRCRRIAAPPLSEAPALIEECSADSRLAVGVDALFKRRVVERPSSSPRELLRHPFICRNHCHWL